MGYKKSTGQGEFNCSRRGEIIKPNLEVNLSSQRPGPQEFFIRGAAGKRKIKQRDRAKEKCLLHRRPGPQMC